MDGERDQDGLPLLYQAICLQNTPPESSEDQAKCMQARSVCWRAQEAQKARRGA